MNQTEQVQEQTCRVCGCTDLDCSGCIERTGQACYWVEEDLCSACVLTAKDFALYLGCWCYDLKNDHRIVLNTQNLNDYDHFNSLDEIKPILRPLPDMTEDEAKHIIGLIRKKLGGDHVWVDDRIQVEMAFQNNRPFYNYLTVDGSNYCTSDLRWSIGDPEVWKYLKSRHFDLFGWIADGLAIDATTMNPNPYAED